MLETCALKQPLFRQSPTPTSGTLSDSRSGHPNTPSLTCTLLRTDLSSFTQQDRLETTFVTVLVACLCSRTCSEWMLSCWITPGSHY